MSSVIHCEVTPHFAYWDRYWGELFRDDDPRFPSIVYGFDTLCEENTGKSFGERTSGGAEITIPAVGACYGYVQTGSIKIRAAGASNTPLTINEEMFFSVANGAEIQFIEAGRIVLVQAVGFLGFNICGGPIEIRGRLKYIDRCSDSVLVASPLMGDPCLNHLHFPPNIDQTEHTHPSTRAGMIARGSGICVTPDGEYPLSPGRIFHIPRDGRHRFATNSDQSMDVIAYHPDSDFGPTHEEHPMVNRTWVDGQKIDNSIGRHTEALTVEGRGAIDVPPEYIPES